MEDANARSVATTAISEAAKIAGPDSQAATRRLRELDPEIEPAISWLASHDPPRSLELIAALRDYWVSAGKQAEALAFVEPVLKKPGMEVPSAQRAAALVAVGTLAFFSANYERAAEYHGNALALAEKLEERGLQADARIGLARVAMQRGDYADMRRQASLSQDLARATGDEPRLALAMHHDAVGADLEGSEEGRDLHLRTLELQRRVGNRRGAALELLNLGVVAIDHGQPAEAQKRLKEALATFHDLGVARNIALSIALLGVANSDLHRYPEAARLLGKGFALKRAMQTTFTVSADQQMERALADCRRELGEEELTRLMAQGEGISEESIVDSR